MRSRHESTGRRVWSQWSCTVVVAVEPASAADDAAELVSALMDDVALAASRFRSDSEVALVNQRAGRATLVSPLMSELVAASLDAARATDGLVDPTVARHLESVGYDVDISELVDRPRSSADDVLRIRPRPARLPDWTAVVHDPALRLVVVPRGLGLDLGAIAKPWTADRAAQQIADRVGGRALVEIGGDLSVAGAGDDPFVIRVAEREGEAGELIAVSRGGVATSTTTVRRWMRGEATAHHLIDPRTGRPCTGRWRTATVWASSAAAANTASTAAIVSGDGALSWLSQHNHAARLVDEHGGVVHTPGWPTPHAVAS